MVDTSDFILLIAALFIFAMLQLGLNSVLLNNSKVMVRTELDYTAVALAQNMADESRRKAFDENEGISLSVPGDFSSTLGPEVGESYPDFNDFDDYHNYSRTDTTEHGVYEIQCTVDYVSTSNLKEPSAVKTPYKRLLVEVVSETKDTVAVTYIKPYY
ncbi:hypothetical protein [Fodinibius salsisoli]|uniref:Uncharacterized protein n=1 Tax=Fodinibius salsisoli TaxID=2820877 RepID=A0ABT3PNC9_9BACT|nr:hypothetical protein [Fodinibius salsisoli]MCW9706809.1 hypothetical protein [Fodinibius salsisoli]